MMSFHLCAETIKPVFEGQNLTAVACPSSLCISCCCCSSSSRSGSSNIYSSVTGEGRGDIFYHNGSHAGQCDAYDAYVIRGSQNSQYSHKQ